MDLTETEDIKKRWQEYMEELYEKDLQDPDNHDDVITHLEPDILESEVKWALESITTNKASGGNRIPVQLFQILKDDAMKVLTQYASKFGKLSSGHRTGKGLFSFQFQRKTMPKNAQTTAQLHSSQFSSVQFSRSVVSDSLRPHESQHARPPCPSPSPRVHSNSRPSSH